MVAVVEGAVELLGGLNLFGDEGGAGAGQLVLDAAELAGVAGLEVELDVVGETDEAVGAGAGEEVVEGDAVAEPLEVLAGGDDLVGDLHGFEDFEDGSFGEAGDEALGERGSGAVDEGFAAVDEVFHPEEQSGVDHLLGGVFGVAGEAVLPAAAEEELVAVDLAVGAQDGLAADEARGPRRGKGCRAGCLVDERIGHKRHS